MKLKMFIGMISALMLMLAACSMNVRNGEEPPPQAAIKAQEALAFMLDKEVGAVTIVEQSQMEWPDGCFGLGGPAEICDTAITPGWRVELSVEDNIYVARTNDSGDLLRFEE